MWRSGTSLLYTLLNQHPRIALLYEDDIALLWPMFRLRRSGVDWRRRWEFWNGALSRHRIDPKQLPPQADAKTAFATACGVYAAGKSASVWGCKSPNYYDCLGRLAEEFSQARFIVIWRNPADICNSILEAAQSEPWFAQSGMCLRALLGFRELKGQCDLLRSRGAALLEIEYDDLVSSTHPVMARICDFLELPFDQRMTSPAGADRSAIYGGRHHALVKSGSVVPSRARPKLVPQEFREKIDRYVCLWRHQFNAQWPRFTGAETCGQKEPGRWERSRDGMLYRGLRLRDRAVPFAYAVAPLPLWSLYRAWKRRRFATVSPDEPASSSRHSVDSTR
jgi:hypothetical protein